MKVKMRIVSLLLVIATMFSIAAAVPVQAAQSNSIRGYIDVYKNGYEVPKTKDFMKILLIFGKFYERITGMKVFSDEKINLVFVGFLTDVYAGVYQQSNGTMDFELLFKTLPVSSAPAKKFYKITNLDREALVKYFAEKEMECYKTGSVLGGVYLFLRVYMNLFDEVVIGAVPVEGQDGVYEILVSVYYEDGTHEDMTPGIYYDTNTTLLYGKDGKGIFNFSYDLDVDDATLSCVIDAWQRNFGFCFTYDVFSYLTPFFDYNTKRVKFIYDNKEWMIQAWKGRYIITAGCEIGVYTRPIGSLGTFYNCASDGDMLLFSMDLYHGSDLILSEPPTLHWWLTAFKFTPKCYLPESLTMYCTVTFKDDEMADAFVRSARWDRGIKDIYQDGATVSFNWQ